MKDLRPLFTGISAVLYIALVPAPAYGGEVPITESTAIALFYQRNLDLISARYHLDQSKAQEVIAAALPNPVFGISVAELDNSGRGGNNDQGPAAGFSVSQLIETAGKRRLRIESSALGTRSSEDDLRDATRTLSTQVRHAFYALLLAQKNAEVAKEAVAHYDKIVAANELRLKQGDIPQSDLWRVKVEAFKARSNLITTNASLDQARIDLGSLLRWPADAMRFRAASEWPAPKNLATGSQDELFVQAINQRPDIQSAREREAQAKKSLTLAKRLAVPDVTIGVGFSHDPNNMNHDTANLMVNVPIPLFYRNQGEIQKAVIDLNAAQLQVQQLEQTVRAEVIAGLTAWDSADTISHGFEKEVLQQVKNIRDGAELSYLKGATNILDLIDAQRDYREVMLAYQNVLYNRAIAYVDLLGAIGEETAP